MKQHTLFEDVEPKLTGARCVASGRMHHYILIGTVGERRVSHPRHGVPMSDPCQRCDYLDRCDGAITGCPTAEAWAWAVSVYLRGRQDE